VSVAPPPVRGGGVTELGRWVSYRSRVATPFPIHPSAWKANSPKFISRILHTSTGKASALPLTNSRPGQPQPYILWCCMIMRCCGYCWPAFQLVSVRTVPYRQNSHHGLCTPS